MALAASGSKETVEEAEHLLGGSLPLEAGWQLPQQAEGSSSRCIQAFALGPQPAEQWPNAIAFYIGDSAPELLEDAGAVPELLQWYLQVQGPDASAKGEQGQQASSFLAGLKKGEQGQPPLGATCDPFASQCLLEERAVAAGKEPFGRAADCCVAWRHCQCRRRASSQKAEGWCGARSPH